jgi:hypothetical protein
MIMVESKIAMVYNMIFMKYLTLFDSLVWWESKHKEKKDFSKN